jgi:AcrR family transcriptional regulator
VNLPITPSRAATARERARAELSREIKEEARRQLAATGADGLSLRAVARKLGMVSSALYRYYPSRDELLTALIIDAYDALGETAERAIATAGTAGDADAAGGAGTIGGTARARWIAACGAVRDWARSNPHEYALIYGSPVPGYRAPEATIGPAARVPLALVGVLAAAVASGEIGRHAAGGEEPPPVDGELAAQAASLASVLSAPEVPPDALVRAVIAWTQLFGMISFELFGQFVGSFDPTDALFANAVVQLAAFVGFG